MELTLSKSSMLDALRAITKYNLGPSSWYLQYTCIPGQFNYKHNYSLYG